MLRELQVAVMDALFERSEAASRLVVSAWGLGGDVVGPRTSYTVITGSA